MPKNGFKRGPMSADHKAKIAAAAVGRSRPAGAGRPQNNADTLWAKVDRRDEDECWPWLGFLSEQGYGRTWIGGTAFYAHRVIYDLAHPGVIQRAAPRSKTDGGYLRHSCDNPTCCNPGHLLVGTHLQNMADKVARGRGPDFSQDRGPRCKLSMQQARLARQRRALGESARALAEAFGISLASMKALLAGKSYKEGGA